MTLIKTISFRKKKPDDPDPLGFLRRRNARSESVAFRNYFRFFETLGTSFKDVHIAVIPAENHSVYEEHIRPGECHINATKVALQTPDHQFHIGFMDSYIVTYNGTGDAGTYQHSFTLVRDDVGPMIVDPTMSMLNITRKGHELESLSCGRNYFGVHIPNDILFPIAIDGIEGTPMGNISGHLKEHVFVSDRLTDEWIEKLTSFKTTSYGQTAQ